MSSICLWRDLSWWGKTVTSFLSRSSSSHAIVQKISIILRSFSRFTINNLLWFQSFTWIICHADCSGSFQGWIYMIVYLSYFRRHNSKKSWLKFLSTIVKQQSQRFSLYRVALSSMRLRLCWVFRYFANWKILLLKDWSIIPLKLKPRSHSRLESSKNSTHSFHLKFSYIHDQLFIHYLPSLEWAIHTLVCDKRT